MVVADIEPSHLESVVFMGKELGNAEDEVEAGKDAAEEVVFEELE